MKPRVDLRQHVTGAENEGNVSNNVMDAAKVQRSANCLLTLDLGVYLGFHQFPLWICERFINVRKEADITACVLEN